MFTIVLAVSACPAKPRIETQPSLALPPMVDAVTSTELAMHTDDQARAWKTIAPTVVPLGQVLPQAAVLRSMGIDVRRLRNHRTEGLFNVVVETWQLSESYDIQWMSDARDRADLGRGDRHIYGVKLLSRPWGSP